MHHHHRPGRLPQKTGQKNRLRQPRIHRRAPLDHSAAPDRQRCQTDQGQTDLPVPVPPPTPRVPRAQLVSLPELYTLMSVSVIEVARAATETHIHLDCTIDDRRQ